MFAKVYAEKHPESFDPNLPNEVVYIGKHKMTDAVEVPGFTVNAGKMVLSPTRTFAPIIREILETDFDAVHGMIHCSGGGQTKCLKYLPAPMRVVKDNLFDIPPVFDLIQKASNADNREMLQVFNMGCRMEIYTNEKDAQKMIDISSKFGVEAKIIGRVEEATEKCLDVYLNNEKFTFIP
jgi:phosphoribosylformylglycinamidine cyclo-ligase